MSALAVPGFGQTTCSIHISIRILSIPYLSFTQGHQTFLYSYHKKCCLQPQPPQELTLGGRFEVCNITNWLFELCFGVGDPKHGDCCSLGANFKHTYAGHYPVMLPVWGLSAQVGGLGVSAPYGQQL